jgi:hypothetical protein
MRTAVFIFALLVRIAAVEMTGATQIAFGDGPDYVAAATSLCVQHAYPERGNLPFFRAPGLPFFIAAVTACEPSRTRAIKYGLAACDAVSVLLIFLIAQLLHGSRAALAAGVLAALHPFFIGAVTDIRTEPLFMMLLVLAIWCLLRGRRAAGVGWVVGAGGGGGARGARAADGVDLRAVVCGVVDVGLADATPAASWRYVCLRCAPHAHAVDRA